MPIRMKKIGQGRENAKKYLHEHPEVLDEIEKQVRGPLRT